MNSQFAMVHKSVDPKQPLNYFLLEPTWIDGVLKEADLRAKENIPNLSRIARHQPIIEFTR